MRELYSDKKYIFINTEYAEAYIPKDIFDRQVDDPTESSLAYNTGDSTITIGIFYMRFFDDENQPREKNKVRTLVYPNMIECKPSGKTTVELLEFNDIEDKYVVLRFYKGDILMTATSQKSSVNCEKFTGLIMSGKIPRSLNYDDCYNAWNKNFNINGVHPAVPAVTLQAIVAKMTRNPADYSKEFRLGLGKGKVNQNSYVMLNMNAVSAYSSVMASMSFERFAEKVTTSINMTKDNVDQKPSPIEEVITM